MSIEQVHEIQSMAEAGQFADALIRLRKIKPLYPRNTFFVALEKQLERLLALPRDTEPSEAQKRELLNSLPGLIRGAIDGICHQPASAAPTGNLPVPARPVVPVQVDRVNKEAARARLKEQYFQHADEFLKQGAYGSALVEIRRVRIIAPDDRMVAEYERTIRQLVDLQQRIGIREAETLKELGDGMPPPLQTDLPRSLDSEPNPVERLVETGKATVIASRPFGRGNKILVTALSVVTTVVVLGVAALILLPEINGMAAENEEIAGIQTPARATPVRLQPPQTRGVTRSVAPADPLPLPIPEEMPGQGSQQAARVQETAPPQTITASAPALRQQASTQGLQRRASFEPAEKPTRSERAVRTPAIVAAALPEHVPPAAGSPEPVANVNRDPEILRLEQPHYPEGALATGGEVVVMVQIDTQGKPVKHLIARSTNPALNQPIVDAVMHSSYSPATDASGPVVKWITIPFHLK
jgi:TonB family protein